MNLIVRIAWRNLWRHRGKSLLVGSILFLGSLIMTIGNGVVAGMNAGLQKNIIHRFTGDMVIVSEKQHSDNVFLDMLGRPTEPLPDYPRIKRLLTELREVDRILPIGKNAAMILNEDGGSMDGGFVLGVDWPQYDSMFPNNYSIVQGRAPLPHEHAVMLGTGAQKTYLLTMGQLFWPESCALDTAILPSQTKSHLHTLQPKNSMVFVGLSNDNTSTDVRLPIRGLFRFNALNSIWGIFILMDIESYRRCFGYVSATDRTMSLTDEQKHLLAMDEADLDGLFGRNLIHTTAAAMASASLEEEATSTEPTATNPDSGTYNLVLVRLKEGFSQEQGLAAVAAALKKGNAAARVVSWQKATGSLGSMAMVIRTALFVFVTLLFFVAILIIVNTLSMAVLERTSEIGMMRAIGARKSFVSMMFIAETLILAAVFGMAGIGCGFLCVKILSALNITTSNDMIQLLYGGESFRPFLQLRDAAMTLMQLAIVSIAAVIYPMRLALSIGPLDAVSRE